jgi:hypothetical protein
MVLNSGNTFGNINTVPILTFSDTQLGNEICGCKNKFGDKINKLLHITARL